ncbi:uncharacterized protein [Coffea arabica]|uniref:Retrotransposon gag protein n=1 Tax=Coffea arabica TaxID=13443 RepID=A0A6P6UZX1_COFAR|nr:uncharacterized protein LOC113715894 [Coffea arabica]
MPRSSHTEELIFDLEVEKIARRTRKETRQLREEQSSVTSQRLDPEAELTDLRGDNSSDSYQENVVMANTQTLRELAAPNLTQQPLCITFPRLSENAAFELKPDLIHLLPTFHDLPGEEPHKHIQEFDVYFYEGLLMNDRNIIDASSGGALVNKTTQEAWELIERMAENCQQFGTRKDVPMRNVNELQEEGTEQANMAGNMPMPRRQYDPYSNSYNSGSRDHPNLSYGGNKQQNFIPNRQQGFQQQYQTRNQPSSASGMSLEDMVKTIASNTMKFQQDTEASSQEMKVRMQNLKNQMIQLASIVNRLDSQGKGKLPSQPEVNPKNVSAMTLRSGKEVEGPAPVAPKDKNEDRIEKELEEEGTPGTNKEVIRNPVIPVKPNPPPFPSRLERPKKQDKEKEILDMFRKVEINIPLLDAIKQVPRYAKFLKDLCINRKKLRGDERIIVGENVSAVLQRKLRPKCGDPRMFTIPCKIGNTSIRNAMLDLGASINVIPKVIYASLNLDPLKETGIIIQLADRTNVYPDGVIEDVLVQVNNLVFSADFYILDMGDEHSPNLSPILLGRPFLSTARTKIDVSEGTLTMEFDGQIVHFNIFEAMKYPCHSNAIFAVSVIDPFV